LGNKSTNLEVQTRVNQLVSLMVRGITKRSDILEYVKKWKWTVETVTVDNVYIKRAREEFAEISKYEAKFELGLSLTRLNDLYYQALDQQDFKTALAVQKEINDLVGIKAAAKQEVEIKGKPEWLK
jgi:hypothetical protein